MRDSLPYSKDQYTGHKEYVSTKSVESKDIRTIDVHRTTVSKPINYTFLKQIVKCSETQPFWYASRPLQDLCACSHFYSGSWR
jgi:hypothetical protein